jgi:hypothetical protein
METRRGANTVAPCAATVAVLLAGQSSSTRPSRLTRSLGLPTAALPVNAERSLAECWARRLVDAGFRGTIVLAVASEQDRAFYGQIAVPPSVKLEVRADSSGHRGAGGTLGDAWRERVSSMDEAAAKGGALVVEVSNSPNFDFARLFAAIDLRLGAVIGAAADATPAGIAWMSSEALALVPPIGFFDLKEQFIPAIVASGRRVEAVVGAAEACRIADISTYLRAIALLRAGGPVSVAADAVIEEGAVVRGDSVVCRGAVVERGALVVDTAVLPGARVCADAVVARSIVPPGSHVPRGYLVVDEVFGALGSSSRLGTEGSAS